MSGTLVVAVIALILSIISLGWQALSFHLSGPVIKVLSTYNSPIFEGKQSDLSYYSVIVVNDGRSPASVTEWGFIRQDGVPLRRYEQEGLPAVAARTLPVRLEPRSEERFYIRPEDVAGQVSGQADKMRPYVRIAGKKIYKGAPGFTDLSG